jgi:N-acetylglucosamine kinase-like BadF-type ATPase
VTFLLGIDIGGSGSRVALLGPDGERRTLDGPRIGVTPGGSSVPETVLALVDAAHGAWLTEVADLAGVGVGATGLATLVADPGAVASSIAARLPARSGATDAAVSPSSDRPAVAVAVDAVTAHLGALGGDAGAVVALGTGAIAIGGDGLGSWRRVDGWGHLLGDRGGGAWIGLRGLDAAVRAFDGVDPSGAALLRLARARFGEPATWPRQLYTRDDRAGVLAGFASAVAEAADTGDARARDILSDAGEEAARSVVAALGDDLPPVIAGTGGVFGAPAVRESFDRAIRAVRPDADLRTAAGGPLDGALILADRVARGRIAGVPGFTWVAP